MKSDLHLHSKYSWDSEVPIKSYIEKAEQLQFGAISITDHNDVSSHSIIDKLQPTTSVVLVPGQEITTTDGHLLVYGWVDEIEPQLTMEETIRIAHRQNGICIAAHPFDPFRYGKFSRIFEFNIDGFEILNASAWFGFPNWLAKRAWKHHQDLIGLGNSDSHRLEEFGFGYSVLPTFTGLENLLVSLKDAEPAGKRIGVIRKLYRLFQRKLS